MTEVKMSEKADDVQRKTLKDLHKARRTAAQDCLKCPAKKNMKGGSRLLHSQIFSDVLEVEVLLLLEHLEVEVLLLLLLSVILACVQDVW